jgi:hypothetical protein
MSVRFWPVGDAHYQEIMVVREAASDPKRTVGRIGLEQATTALMLVSDEHGRRNVDESHHLLDVYPASF